ncbi:hydroxysqualene dehydroxylase HpnE [Paralimibaculum aggregatum]|uniref:Hydroxysqualene dehydroxylase HpnE n=1 Tax=Paralimibaculum aggregatum TaxID=3036245 RepID=A0ABQ6LLH6_9RHOB|nr:hydroxysqualene dehydroxylase HpnE [Limibaculum sp. NKW23]GMG81276.1 hydroxysqualene dehydroxylase HpnE [Limibaculum sp. NKW23]
MAESRAGRVHVVGAGLAGLSTALRLAERGAAVTLHEAQRQAGGRCRSFDDPRLGRRIDNGNHLVLSGNASVRAYLRAIGAEDRLVAEPEAGFAFVDLATGRRWRVRLNDGPVPWWVGTASRRIPETTVADYLSGAWLALAGRGATVAEAIRARGPIWARFWEPLTLAAINTTPERASARLLWRVLAETFLRGGAHARPMLAPGGLGDALVGPAEAALAARGVEIRFGRILRAVEREGGRAATLRFSDGAEALGPADRVVLALPPSRLAPLMPELALPDDDCAILNAFFVVPEAARAALDRAAPITGVLSARTHWIFRRGDVVSLTVSASDRLGLDRADPAELTAMLWAETRAALGLGAEMSYANARINKERRATFDQSPAGVARRPAARTGLGNLWLAGDATDTGLPATIEGAIRSGETAARLAA